MWRRWASKFAQLHKPGKHNLVDLILKHSLMNKDQNNALLTHALVMWAGLKYMIKRMKPESATSTSSVNSTWNIKKWQRRNRVQYLSRYGIWIFGLENFSQFYLIHGTTHIKNLPCGVTWGFNTANTKKQQHFILSQFQPSLIFTSSTKTTVKIYTVSQADCTRLWENVP
jgi:hypothetical protein